jgi:Zn-dependent protease
MEDRPARTWTLFRLRGVPVRIRPPVAFVLLGVVAFEIVATRDLIEGLIYTGTILALLLSVLVHELGHALAASALGLHVDGITLHGLYTATRTGPVITPRQEWVVALGGPLASLAAGLILGGTWLLLRRPGDWFGLRGLWAVNLALGVLNLVPAFPLDGGRLLRAALRRRYDELAATRRAVWVGRLIALALLASAFVAGLGVLRLVMPLGGLVILILGEGEWQRVRLDHLARQRGHAEAAPRDAD